MHFCPRKGCRRGYHDKCLARDSFISPESTLQPLGLILSSPDHKDAFTLPSKKSQKKNAADNITYQMLAGIPKELIKAARQPMLRGARCLRTGFVGNVKHVAAARRLVYKFLQGNGPDNWREQVDVSKAIVETARRKTFPCFVCPKCGGFI
jgi:hypothetical protein